MAGTEAAFFSTGDAGYENAALVYFRYSYPNALYFPVATYVPAGSTIDSATLEVYVYEEYNTTTANIECGYVTDPDNTGVWHDRGSGTEGSGLGATLAKKDAASSTYWTNNENYFTAVMSSMACGQSDVQTTGWKSWDATNVIQAWQNGAYPNRGFWLREASGANSNARARAKYYSTTSQRPKLTINYTPPANPPSGALVLNNPTAGSQNVTISWNSVNATDGYKVRYGTASGNYTTTLNVGNITQYTVTGLINGATYYFVVAAYNSAGDGSNSNEKSSTPFYAPNSSTVVIQEGTDGVTGTEAAYFATSNANYASATKLYFRYSYPNVLYFPVAANVPAGATVNSATLEVYVYEEYNTGVKNVECGYVTDPDNTGDWHDRGSGTEGYGLGATMGKKDAAVSVYWDNAQSLFTDVMGPVSCGQANLQTTGWKSWDATAVVQGWLGDTYVNRGFWLRETSGANSNANARAKYHGTASLRPKLTITYTLATQPPASAPTLNAPTAGNQSVALSWNSISDADGYKVKYGATPGNYTTTINVGNATQYLVNGLTNGLTYYFVVLAYNTGGEGPDSNEESAAPQSPVPGAPVLNSVTPGDQTATLSWQSSSGATGYKVYYGTTSRSYGTPVDAGDVTSYQVTGLTNGTLYYFAVTAQNAGGESSVSNEISVTPQFSAPAAPTLNTADAGDTQVTLGWSSVSGATNYNVKVGTASGNYTTTIPLGNVTGHAVTGLTNGTLYYFAVTAQNAGGESSVSNEVSVTPQFSAPLLGLVAYYPFNGNANDESGHGNFGTVNGAVLTSDRFGRADSAYQFDGNDYIKVKADNFPTAERTVSLWFYVDDVSANPTFLGYGGGGAVSWNMQISQSTIFTAHAHFGAEIISVDVLQPPVGKWFHWVITTAPGGTKAYIDGVEVASNAKFINNTNVAGKDFALGCGVNGSGFTPFQNVSMRCLTGLLDDVRIYNRALSAPEVLGLYETTREDTSAPAVVGLTDAFAGDRRVELRWIPGNNSTGFKVKYGTSPGLYPSVIDVNYVTSYLVTGLTNDTTYYFVVSAYNDTQEGGDSNELSALPRDNPATEVSGPISENTYWSAVSSPYIVMGDITVNPGVTLTIGAGAVIKFNGHYFIDGQGVINAQGSAGNPITFTSNQPVPAKGDWDAIYLRGSQNVLGYVDIAYADKGVYIPSFPLNQTPTIQNSNIHHNNTGIYFEPSTGPYILANTVVNNTDGIFAGCNDFTGCAPTINNNDIYDNTQYNLRVHSYLGNASATTINAQNNWWGSNVVAAIADTVYDNSDEPILPVVDYVPFLDSPGGSSINLVPPVLNYAVTGNQQVELYWTAVPDATGYNVKVGTASGIYGAPIDAGNVTNYMVTGLTNGAPYYFVVSARNPTEESADSNEAVETPRDAVFVSGSINQNTTWTLSNAPYYIVGDTVVEAGATLTVDPGVTVIFEGEFKVDVKGKLSAQGGPGNLITFTSGQPAPAAGDWKTISFIGSDPASLLDFVRVQYAQTGATFEGTSPVVQNSIFEYNQTGIKIFKLSSVSIHDNAIRDNTQYGIQLIGQYGAIPSPVIRNNSLENNGLYNLYTGFSAANYNQSARVIDAEDNWWGSDVPEQISATIWDFYDSNWRPIIDFSPYLAAGPGQSLRITGNSVTGRFFNIRGLESASINYTLDTGADVTLKIYSYPAKVLVRTLLNAQPRLAGIHTELWDGKDDVNQFLPAGVYTYIVDAQAADGKKGRYDPVLLEGLEAPPVISNVTLTPSGSFSPFKGERLEIRYDIDKPALVSLGFVNFAGYLDNAPRDTSGNVDYWDGRDGSGNIIVRGDPVYVEARTVNIPENVLVIQDDTSFDIPVLFSDPYLIRPLYNEVTRVTYSINEEADVKVSVLSPDGSRTLNVLEPLGHKTAGTYTLTWDGRTSAGETVAVEGNYRVRVEAVDSFGVTTTRDGNIRILF